MSYNRPPQPNGYHCSVCRKWVPAGQACDKTAPAHQQQEIWRNTPTRGIALQPLQDLSRGHLERASAPSSSKPPRPIGAQAPSGSSAQPRTRAQAQGRLYHPHTRLLALLTSTTAASSTRPPRETIQDADRILPIDLEPYFRPVKVKNNQGYWDNGYECKLCGVRPVTSRQNAVRHVKARHKNGTSRGAHPGGSDNRTS